MPPRRSGGEGPRGVRGDARSRPAAEAEPRRAELHQAAKLFELLPQRPNDLWQMDVTYIHIPGYGWWYAVTVIDYYSRYLLACHLTHSYSAVETAHALKLRARKRNGFTDRWRSGRSW